MKQLQLIFRYIYLIIKYLGIVIVGYFLLAVGGAFIPTGSEKPQKTGEIIIFITSYGLHSDIVVPLKNRHWNWLDRLDTNFQIYQNHPYLAFGWGDYDFYLKSKTKTSVLDGLNSLFIPSKGILHLQFYQNQLSENEQVIQLGISRGQYLKLCQYLENQAVMDSNKQMRLIENGYGANDYFWAAKGLYHLFYTCNNWTNDALKAMNLRTGLWTPFKESIWIWLK
jgi:uncharacterized protein (TIGR02117 family)